MSCSVNMDAENDYKLAARTDIVTFLLNKCTFLVLLWHLSTPVVHSHSFLLQVL